MKMFPGNESEKPVLREVIDLLKSQNNINGKTIHVADKGLNCAKNIIHARKNGDGYLFSKSVKSLPEIEKTWVLLDAGFVDVKDSRGKILYRYKSCIDEFPYKMEQEGRIDTVKLREKRIEMKDSDIYDVYHNLWRIEESFKIMKSDLDARPVFLQKEETIKGHFLICYLTVLLERIFQFKILENKYSTTEIFQFIKDFKVTKGESKYINTTKSSDFIHELALRSKLPLTNYFLSETQIKSILKYKI